MWNKQSEAWMHFRVQKSTCWRRPNQAHLVIFISLIFHFSIFWVFFSFFKLVFFFKEIKISIRKCVLLFTADLNPLCCCTNPIFYIYVQLHQIMYWILHYALNMLIPLPFFCPNLLHHMDLCFFKNKNWWIWKS